MHLNLSTPGRRAFPEDDLSFAWFMDPHPSPCPAEQAARVEARETFIQLREGHEGEKEALRL